MGDLMKKVEFVSLKNSSSLLYSSNSCIVGKDVGARRENIVVEFF